PPRRQSSSSRRSRTDTCALPGPAGAFRAGRCVRPCIRSLSGAPESSPTRRRHSGGSASSAVANGNRRSEGQYGEVARDVGTWGQEGKLGTIIMAVCDRFSNKKRQRCFHWRARLRQESATKPDRAPSGFLPHVHAGGDVEALGRGLDPLVRRL